MIKTSGLWAACVAGVLLGMGCATTSPVHVDSLTFEMSHQWRLESPGHDTRRLQCSVPSHVAELKDARLTVWHFPGIRDSGDHFVIQQTFDRWQNQFDQGDVDPAYQLASHSEYRINGLPVYTIDLTGRYVAETAPGSGLDMSKPNHRMLGAYIVAPRGDYIVKLVGPASVVARHQGAFETFIRSVRPSDQAFDVGTPAIPGRRNAVLTATRSDR